MECGKYKLGNRSLKRLEGVDSRVLALAELAIKYTCVDFGIAEHGGKRSVEVQRHLYLENLSNCDGITNESAHQSGLALDYYAINPDNREATWDHKYMCQVAWAFFRAAQELEIRIEWGGFWKSFSDSPHIEII